MRDNEYFPLRQYVRVSTESVVYIKGGCVDKIPFTVEDKRGKVVRVEATISGKCFDMESGNRIMLPLHVRKSCARQWHGFMDSAWSVALSDNAGVFIHYSIDDRLSFSEIKGQVDQFIVALWGAA